MLGYRTTTSSMDMQDKTQMARAIKEQVTSW
jgi:hypothetical protein